jgi:hypothetical protein
MPCECPERRSVTVIDALVAAVGVDKDEPTPQPHEPGECPGTYRLAKYRRDGRELMLCSWYVYPLTDVPVS